MPPVPAPTTTQAVSASILLDEIARWDGLSPDIEQVLDAAFDAKDYPDCIIDLPKRNIDPLSYLNNLDKVGSCLIFWGPSIHRDTAIDHR